jgi:hypothetical protein
VVASGIGGYWVQLVEGLVMAGVVVLNVLIGEEGISVLARAARKWTVPPAGDRPAEPANARKE